jgi:hypothetical protein
MTATTTPPQQRPGDGPEDIDRLLGAFFRSEVPKPWPSLSAPTVTPARAWKRSTLRTGRLALAASVAVLLASGWLLSGRMPSVPVDAGSLDSGKAGVPHELRPGRTPPIAPPNQPK